MPAARLHRALILPVQAAAMLRILSFAVWLLLCTAAARADMIGQVVRILDGDTVSVLIDRREVRVRLADIDAPESHQPYGERSRQELADIVFRQQVRVVVVDTDRYGRTVARLFVGRRNANVEMVRRGAAWVYPDYNRDPSLPALEAQARAARRGLWRLQSDQHVPPWEWRRAERRR